MGNDSELAMGLVQGQAAGSTQVGTDMALDCLLGAALSFDICFFCHLDSIGSCSRGMFTPHKATCKRVFTAISAAREPSNRETAH